jgi:hypothetical protein
MGKSLYLLLHYKSTNIDIRNIWLSLNQKSTGAPLKYKLFAEWITTVAWGLSLKLGSPMGFIYRSDGGVAICILLSRVLYKSGLSSFDVEREII